MKKKVLILGSTGSIGRQTLEVINHFPQLFEVVGLSAYSQTDRLNEQIAAFNVSYAAIANSDSYDKVTKDNCQVFSGEEGILELCEACGADIVVAAIVGLAGLRAVLRCIELGMTIALANKETLVGGGAIVKEAQRKHGVDILPVDSEHSAIFQCIQSDANREGIKRIIITASGGPFVDWSKEDLQHVTVEQALNHPNWAMGSKITIDSATMMNKGLEVIEAKWLFDLDPKQINVAVHRKSIVHSMVEFKDHSMVAQLGNPDMRIPIQYALVYPERLEGVSPPLDIFSMGSLEFLRPDFEKFPCLGIAYRALEHGKGKSLVVNAANEIAVETFLRDKLSFMGIIDVIEYAYHCMPDIDEGDLSTLLQLDQATRERCRAYIKETIHG